MNPPNGMLSVKLEFLIKLLFYRDIYFSLNPKNHSDDIVHCFLNKSDKNSEFKEKNFRPDSNFPMK